MQSLVQHFIQSKMALIPLFCFHLAQVADCTELFATVALSLSHTHVNVVLNCLAYVSPHLYVHSCRIVDLFCGCNCFRNPPNSDMDYRIFNMHTWTFLCVRIHMGFGDIDNEWAQHFLLGKTLTKFSCALHGVRTSGLWVLSPTLYQLSHPVTPFSLLSELVTYAQGWKWPSCIRNRAGHGT